MGIFFLIHEKKTPFVRKNNIILLKWWNDEIMDNLSTRRENKNWRDYAYRNCKHHVMYATWGRNSDTITNQVDTRVFIPSSRWSSHHSLWKMSLETKKNSRRPQKFTFLAAYYLFDFFIQTECPNFRVTDPIFQKNV